MFLQQRRRRGQFRSQDRLRMRRRERGGKGHNTREKNASILRESLDGSLVEVGFNKSVLRTHRLNLDDNATARTRDGRECQGEEGVLSDRAVGIYESPIVLGVVGRINVGIDR